MSRAGRTEARYNAPTMEGGPERMPSAMRRARLALLAVCEIALGGWILYDGTLRSRPSDGLVIAGVILIVAGGITLMVSLRGIGRDWDIIDGL